MRYKDHEIQQFEAFEEDRDFQENQEEDSMAEDDIVIAPDLNQQVQAWEAHPNVLDDNKNSARKKKKTALKHFYDFLLTYWQVMRPNDRVVPDCPRYKKVTLDDLSHKLFGCFAYHLAHAENKTRRGDQVYIRWNSAVGYLSAVKSYFRERDHYRSLSEERPVFLAHNWSAINTKLTSIIVERHKVTGDPLIDPKATAKTDDWVALACICVWIGNQKITEFWCIFVSLVHMAATRGTKDEKL